MSTLFKWLATLLAPFLILTLGITSWVVDLPWKSADVVGQDTAQVGSAPEEPSAKEKKQQADNKAMQAAKDSTNGQALQNQGFKRLAVLQYQPLVDFLNGQLNTKDVRYVQFTRNPTDELPPQYEDTERGKPDVIIESTTGLMVALSKNYANGRGLTCFTRKDPRDLQGVFNEISKAVWNKSADQAYTHAEVPAIPSGVTCFAQAS